MSMTKEELDDFMEYLDLLDEIEKEANDNV